MHLYFKISKESGFLILFILTDSRRWAALTSSTELKNEGQDVLHTGCKYSVVGISDPVYRVCLVLACTIFPLLFQYVNAVNFISLLIVDCCVFCSLSTRLKLSILLFPELYPSTYMLTQWMISDKWLDLDYLPLYILDSHVIAIRLKLIGLCKICNKQLQYLVNGRKSRHACSLNSRWCYFVLAHSCSTLPFYYTFQPTYNFAKALYDASTIIKILKEKLSLNYIHTLKHWKTLYMTLAVNISIHITVYGTLSQISL